jgi:hypothetical protein
MVKGKSINMCAIRRQLEQWVQRRGVVREFEQQPDELERQRWVCLRLKYLKLRVFEIVELQGLGFPALCEINSPGFFGRAFCFENQPRQGFFL